MGFKFDKDKIIKAVGDKLISGYKNAVVGVVCPVHKTPANVVFKGMVGDQIQWEVRDACCKAQTEAVADAIRAATKRLTK